MRPPFSVSLEPGLDRGVPWGRDLFTFVTSAASHMMRTLQKPRKNRPSKRQVNHRRFLHNMIQRKFADIEAANHRLASSLYSKDRDEDMCTVSLDKPETPDDAGNPLHRDCLLDPEKDGAHKDTDNLYKPSCTMSSDVIVSKGKHHHHLKPSMFPSRTDDQSGTKQRKEKSLKGVEFTSINFPKGDNSNQGRSTFQLESCNETLFLDNVSEKTQTTMNESSFIQFEETTSAFVSPELSPLSLDLCDFSILVCADKPRNMEDTTEGQLKDIIDHLSTGNKDFGVGSDVDDYFESIFGRQGDTEGTEPSNSFPEVEDVHCGGDDYPYHHGYHSHDDTSTTDLCLSSLHCAPEEELTNFRKTDCAQSLFSSSSVSVTPLQTCNGPHQDLTACRLNNCSNRNLNFTPFEGVAQSFSAPVHHHENNRPVSTPPPEDDWLFTDILKDTNSPDF